MVETMTTRTVMGAQSQEHQLTDTAHAASLKAAIDDLGNRIKQESDGLRRRSCEG